MGKLKVISGGRCLSDINCPAVMVDEDGNIVVIGGTPEEQPDGTTKVVIPREIMLKALELLKERDAAQPA